MTSRWKKRWLVDGDGSSRRTVEPSRSVVRWMAANATIECAVVIHCTIVHDVGLAEE